MTTNIPTQFFGTEGAGALIIAATTGRVLLVFRSPEVLEPHVWGTPGGKIDSAEETPKNTAIREVKEEVGYEGNILLLSSYVFVDSASGFKYHNFIGIVPEEFTPKTNWENENAQWFELDKLPEPLHFGFKLFLENAIHIKKLVQLIKAPESKELIKYHVQQF